MTTLNWNPIRHGILRDIAAGTWNTGGDAEEKRAAVAIYQAGLMVVSPRPPHVIMLTAAGRTQLAEWNSEHPARTSPRRTR